MISLQGHYDIHPTCPQHCSAVRQDTCKSHPSHQHRFPYDNDWTTALTLTVLDLALAVEVALALEMEAEAQALETEAEAQELAKENRILGSLCRPCMHHEHRHVCPSAVGSRMHGAHTPNF